MKKIITHSSTETKRYGERLINFILEKGPIEHALILLLRGGLGSGKTTFLQGVAKGLKIKERITSPTFIIERRFPLKNDKIRKRGFRNFYHIDCYRLKNKKDFQILGLNKIFSDPRNIIAIEWSQKIKEILPQYSVFIDFKFLTPSQRQIKIKLTHKKWKNLF